MFRRIASCCDRSNNGESASADVRRQKAYEKVLTNSENKHMALAIVDNFLTMLKTRKNVLTVKKIDNVGRDRRRGKIVTNRKQDAANPLESIDKDYVRKIFEKINEIKQASSGWFGCGRASDAVLEQLHADMDNIISEAHSTLSPKMKNKLLGLLKLKTEVDGRVAAERAPLLDCVRQESDDTSYLKNAFDIVMRNDSRVFQVTIPKALAELYEKYKRADWATTFIATNVKIGDKKKYELKNLAPKKKYLNPFVERHLESRADGMVKLVYRLINPKDPKETMVLAAKYRLVDGTPLYIPELVGEGRFGAAHRYKGSGDCGVDHSGYLKKRYKVVKDSRNAMSTNEEEKYLLSYYMACLQFELNKVKFGGEMVKLNHPIASSMDHNITKAIAQVADGDAKWHAEQPLSIEDFKQLLRVTTVLHICGAFALDNKPENYIKSADGSLKRIDLDFDAFAAKNLDKEEMKFPHNPTECPRGNKDPLRNMYESIKKVKQYSEVGIATVRADFYRGQSLVGLVFSNIDVDTSRGWSINIENRYKDMKYDEHVYNSRFANFMKEEALPLVLPEDVGPHDREKFIEFVVNWHFNINHEQIARFLINYRERNNLMDPRNHLPAPRTSVGDQGISSPQDLTGYIA